MFFCTNFSYVGGFFLFHNDPCTSFHFPTKSPSPGLIPILYGTSHVARYLQISRKCDRAQQQFNKTMATKSQPTTEIINKTQGTLTMQVGNHHHFVALTTLEKDAKCTMPVDFNATYQEYLMGVDETGKKLIVTSDDCCDYKCITIQEANGKFDMHKEPRQPVTLPNIAKPESTTSSPSSNSLGGSDDESMSIDAEGDGAHVLAEKNAKPVQLLTRIWDNLCSKFIGT